MRDLYIDNKRIDLASYIANNGTTAGTSASARPCPGSCPRTPCTSSGEGLSASSACHVGRRAVTGGLKLMCVIWVSSGCHAKHSFCDSNPCKNGGTCSVSWGTYSCLCPVGFGGKDCRHGE